MADYDHDGDMDLLVGDDNGNIKLYLRDEEGNLSFEGLLQADGEALTAGFRAAPEWTDWDLDGDFDLLVGSSLGLVTLFINVGSLEEPEFSVSHNLSADGQEIWIGTETIAAYGDLDGDGKRDLVVGSIFGDFTYFGNIGEDDDAEFAAGILLADTEGIISVESYSRPDLFDWDDDGDLDLIAGGRPPEVLVFLNPGEVSVSEKNISFPQDFAITSAYPDPFNSRSTLVFRVENSARLVMHVYSADGRMVSDTELGVYNPGYYRVPLDMCNLSGGRYLVRLCSGGRIAQRMITHVR